MNKIKVWASFLGRIINKKTWLKRWTKSSASSSASFTRRPDRRSCTSSRRSASPGTICSISFYRKVMFSQVSVCPQGGWLPSITGHMTRRVCIQGVSTSGRRRICIHGGLGTPPELGKQAVSILWECFLVFCFFPIEISGVTVASVYVLYVSVFKRWEGPAPILFFSFSCIFGKCYAK